MIKLTAMAKFARNENTERCLRSRMKTKRITGGRKHSMYTLKSVVFLSAGVVVPVLFIAYGLVWAYPSQTWHKVSRERERARLALGELQAVLALRLTHLTTVQSHDGVKKNSFAANTHFAADVLPRLACRKRNQENEFNRKDGSKITSRGHTT